MTPEQWKKVKEIYKQLHGLPKEEQEASLPGMCKGDEELHSHLICLLNMPPGFLAHEAPRPYSCTDILLSPGEVLAGRWQIVIFLGNGGMADVYAAYDKELEKSVALKVIRSDVSFDNSLLDRFKKEVELARQVRHRNVCAVYDIGRDHRGSRDLIFLTMELIPGETMAARLERTGPLDPSEWFPVAEQLCKAIQEAHRTKVLHRDFKPGNVMLVGSREDIRAIVTDFGIARAIGGERDSGIGLTARSMILGTWPYMSPEQRRGEELAETSDIYSLGLVLYEMITGLQYCRVPKLENIPDDGNWRHTIGRCLEENSAKRFGSALELLDALRQTSRLREHSKLLPSFLRLFRRRLQIGATIICLFLPILVEWNRIFHPLPHEMRVAMILPQASGDKEIETLLAAWFETAAQKINNLKDQNLSIIPLADTMETSEGEISSASRSYGFNLYIKCVTEKRDNQVDLDLRLQEVSTGRVLRSSKLSIYANDSGSSLPPKIAALFGRQISLEHDDLSSKDEQALRFFKSGTAFLLHRDIPNIEYAISDFKKAIGKDQQFAKAYAYLAFAYSLRYRKNQNQDDMTNVLLVQGRLSILKIDLPLARLAVGLVSQSNGKLDSAIKEFEEVLSLYQDNREVRNLLSMAYLEDGKIDDAIRLSKEAVKFDDQSWSNHFDLGYAYYSNGELENAEKEFRKALELAPDNPMVNAGLAEMCICSGEYDSAKAILDPIVKYKKDAMSETNLARIYEQNGHYADAIGLLQNATELRPMVDKYWLELGDAYMLQKKKSKAMKTFRKGLEVAEAYFILNSKDSETLLRTALFNAKLGSKQKALNQLRQVEKALGDKKSLRPDFIIDSARIYELIGNRTRALDTLRSVLPNKCALFDAEITPDFASLRSDRRYKEIIRQASLQQKL